MGKVGKMSRGAGREYGRNDRDLAAKGTDCFVRKRQQILTIDNLLARGQAQLRQCLRHVANPTFTTQVQKRPIRALPQ